MFCPFIKGECREDCTFRHMARGTVGNMTQPTHPCTSRRPVVECERRREVNPQWTIHGSGK